MADINYSSSGYSSSRNQNMPAYKQPKYDQEKIGLYTNQQMWPGLSSLRNEASKFQTGYFRSPVEKAMASRTMLEGYGRGLGELQSGATRAAQGLYSQEYSGLENQALKDYERGMNQWDTWRKEQASVEGLRDPRGPHPPSYSSWEEYDRAVATARPTGNTSYANLPFGGERRGLGLPGTGPGEYNAQSTPSGITYGAGSEKAYKRAIREGELATGGYPKVAGQGLQGWDMGGGKSGLSLLDSYKGFNPFA